PMSYLGGDYYSFVRHGRRVGILVADVTGHGLPAALDASAVHVAHQTIYKRSQSAADVLSGMNEFLAPVSSYRFTSAVYAILDTDSGALEVSRAGHPAPYILRSDGSVVEVGPEAPLLGMRPEMQYMQLEYQLFPEDRLILYTDGVFEVPDRGQGVESVPSMQEAIRRNSHLDGESFAVAVCSLFAAFRAQEDQDDITLLQIKWEGPQTVR
ncbi:MAG: serine/threonine-protein phosphatase, partial [Leptospiraceae bacterium]|nr:serine/threonine-protein phosphatase [Leptospiraceae bacterium]